MSVEPQTWIVGCTDEAGFVTQCLLKLEERFALPETVRVCHGARWSGIGEEQAGRVLAIVADPPGAGADFLGLLREAEARAVIGADAPDAVAVAVARARDNSVEDAVHLAVTTLIDWGHEVTARR